MSIVDNLRKLPTPLLVLHIASKAIIGFGLGIMFARQLSNLGGWIILLGIILSIPPVYKIFRGN